MTVKTIAVGGVEHITLSPAAANRYAADTRDSSVASVVSSAGDGTVLVRGSGIGTTELRITDAITLALEDQVAVNVNRVTRVDLAPIGDPDFYPPPEAWALTANVNVEIAVRFFGADARARLVDEGARVSSTATQAITMQLAWDKISLTASNPGTLDVVLRSGTRFVARYDVASVADDIVPILGSLSFEAASSTFSVPVGSQPLFCFRALSRGRRLLGMTWSAHTEAPLVVHDLRDLLGPSCFALDPIGAGTSVVLDVNASGFEKAFHILAQ